MYDFGIHQNQQTNAGFSGRPAGAEQLHHHAEEDDDNAPLPLLAHDDLTVYDKPTLHSSQQHAAGGGGGGGAADESTSQPQTRRNAAVRGLASLFESSSSFSGGHRMCGDSHPYWLHFQNEVVESEFAVFYFRDRGYVLAVTNSTVLVAILAYALCMHFLSAPLGTAMITVIVVCVVLQLFISVLVAVLKRRFETLTEKAWLKEQDTHELRLFTEECEIRIEMRRNANLHEYLPLSSLLVGVFFSYALLFRRPECVGLEPGTQAFQECKHTLNAEAVFHLMLILGINRTVRLQKLLVVMIVCVAGAFGARGISPVGLIFVHDVSFAIITAGLLVGVAMIAILGEQGARITFEHFVQQRFRAASSAWLKKQTEQTLAAQVPPGAGLAAAVKDRDGMWGMSPTLAVCGVSIDRFREWGAYLSSYDIVALLSAVTDAADEALLISETKAARYHSLGDMYLLGLCLSAADPKEVKKELHGLLKFASISVVNCATAADHQLELAMQLLPAESLRDLEERWKRAPAVRVACHVGVGCSVTLWGSKNVVLAGPVLDELLELPAALWQRQEDELQRQTNTNANSSSSPSARRNPSGLSTRTGEAYCQRIYELTTDHSRLLTTEKQAFSRLLPLESTGASGVTTTTLPPCLPSSTTANSRHCITASQTALQHLWRSSDRTNPPTQCSLLLHLHDANGEDMPFLIAVDHVQLEIVSVVPPSRTADTDKHPEQLLLSAQPSSLTGMYRASRSFAANPFAQHLGSSSGSRLLGGGPPSRSAMMQLHTNTIHGNNNNNTTSSLPNQSFVSGTITNDGVGPLAGVSSSEHTNPAQQQQQQQQQRRLSTTHTVHSNSAVTLTSSTGEGASGGGGSADVVVVLNPLLAPQLKHTTRTTSTSASTATAHRSRLPSRHLLGGQSQIPQEPQQQQQQQQHATAAAAAAEAVEDDEEDPSAAPHVPQSEFTTNSFADEATLVPEWGCFGARFQSDELEREYILWSRVPTEVVRLQLGSVFSVAISLSIIAVTLLYRELRVLDGDKPLLYAVLSMVVNLFRCCMIWIFRDRIPRVFETLLAYCFYFTTAAALLLSPAGTVFGNTLFIMLSPLVLFRASRPHWFNPVVTWIPAPLYVIPILAWTFYKPAGTTFNVWTMRLWLVVGLLTSYRGTRAFDLTRRMEFLPQIRAKRLQQQLEEDYRRFQRLLEDITPQGVAAALMRQARRPQHLLAQQQQVETSMGGMPQNTMKQGRMRHTRRSMMAPATVRRINHSRNEAFSNMPNLHRAELLMTGTQDTLFVLIELQPCIPVTSLTAPTTAAAAAASLGGGRSVTAADRVVGLSDSANGVGGAFQQSMNTFTTSSTVASPNHQHNNNNNSSSNKVPQQSPQAANALSRMEDELRQALRPVVKGHRLIARLVRAPTNGVAGDRYDAALEGSTSRNHHHTTATAPMMTALFKQHSTSDRGDFTTFLPGGGGGGGGGTEENITSNDDDDSFSYEGLSFVKASAHVAMVAVDNEVAQVEDAQVLLDFVCRVHKALQGVEGLQHRAVVSSGPVVGCVLGSRSVSFEYYGAAVCVASRLLEEVPWGSVAATTAVIRSHAVTQYQGYLPDQLHEVPYTMRLRSGRQVEWAPSSRTQARYLPPARLQTLRLSPIAEPD